MTDRELMQQALEDICGAKLCEFNSMSSRQEMVRLMDSAITALRAALAEPEQERPHLDYPCRSDGRCQYAIDSGAEGLGHCPPGKCCMAARLEPTAQEVQNAAENLALMKRMFPQPQTTHWEGCEAVHPECKAALRERLANAPDGWQPIETAPKTGRKVILFYLNRNNLPRTVMARWLTDEEAAETDADGVGLEGGWYECIDNWADYTDVAIHEGEPTHWMPLPAAPQQGDKP